MEESISLRSLICRLIAAVFGEVGPFVSAGKATRLGGIATDFREVDSQFRTIGFGEKRVRRLIEGRGPRYDVATLYECRLRLQHSWAANDCWPLYGLVANIRTAKHVKITIATRDVQKPRP